MQRVTVQAGIAGTAVEEVWEAPRVWVQVWDGGRAKLTLFDDAGRETGLVIYPRVERVHRQELS